MISLTDLLVSIGAEVKTKLPGAYDHYNNKEKDENGVIMLHR